MTNKKQTEAEPLRRSIRNGLRNPPRNPIFFDREERMTQQQFAESCNINNILAKYQKTGLIDHVAKYQPQYGDCSGADYTEAMRTVANAKSMFEELPSSVRANFDHNPANFLDFARDLTPEDANEKLRKVGLIPTKKATSEPDQVVEETTPEVAEPINPT